MRLFCCPEVHPHSFERITFDKLVLTMHCYLLTNCMLVLTRWQKPVFPGRVFTGFNHQVAKKTHNPGTKMCIKAKI